MIVCGRCARGFMRRQRKILAYRGKLRYARPTLRRIAAGRRAPAVTSDPHWMPHVVVYVRKALLIPRHEQSLHRPAVKLIMRQLPGMGLTCRNPRNSCKRTGAFKHRFLWPYNLGVPGAAGRIRTPAPQIVVWCSIAALIILCLSTPTLSNNISRNDWLSSAIGAVVSSLQRLRLSGVPPRRLSRRGGASVVRQMPP